MQDKGAQPNATATPSSSSSSGSVQLKRAVAGQPVDVQMAMLNPKDAPADIGGKAGGAASPANERVAHADNKAPVQRRVRAIQRSSGEAQQSEAKQSEAGSPFMLGAMRPMGDQTALCVVQMETTGANTVPPVTPPPNAESAARPAAPVVMYKWVAKTVEGKTVNYLVRDDEKGDVQLGPVQRHELTENFDLEARVRALELTIGQLAEGHEAGQTAGRALAGRCIQIADAFFAKVGEVQYMEQNWRTKEMEAKTLGFGTTLGTTNPAFAGALTTTPEAIRAAGVSGNIRETLTIANNFLWSFGAAFVNAEGRDPEADAIIAQLRAQEGPLAERLQTMSTADNLLIPDSAPAVQDQIAEQGQMRDRAPAGTQKQTTKTLGQLRRELNKELPLSNAEMTMMGLTPSDTVSKEELEAKRLTWEEGMRCFVIKSNAITQKLQQAAVPMGAGTSGTTARLMSLGPLLGYNNPIGLRAACIGYLIPIRAHTLWEVLQGAVSGGAPAPARDLSAFNEVAPFGPSRALYPDEDFWQAVSDHMNPPRNVGGGGSGGGGGGGGGT